MRILLQRVRQASVTVSGETVGDIGRGLLLLVGATHGDDAATAVRLAEKAAHLRIFEDADGKMNRSLLDCAIDEPALYGALVISQFTLYADARRGRRPSFIHAASPEVASPLVDTVADHLAGLRLRVERGRFGAEMQVALVNDGPVTLWLDSAELNR